MWKFALVATRRIYIRIGAKITFAIVAGITGVKTLMLLKVFHISLRSFLEEHGYLVVLFFMPSFL